MLMNDVEELTQLLLLEVDCGLLVSHQHSGLAAFGNSNGRKAISEP